MAQTLWQVVILLDIMPLARKVCQGARFTVTTSGVKLLQLVDNHFCPD